MGHPHVLQYFEMGNTITVRLPVELIDRLRRVARSTGLPIGRVVRESLETTLPEKEDKEQPWMKYVGTVDGPPDLSSRKGFSRK